MWEVVLTWEQNSRSAPLEERVSAPLAETTVGCVVALYSIVATMMSLTRVKVRAIVPERVYLLENN